jgi:RHS repeat-associated protein
VTGAGGPIHLQARVLDTATGQFLSPDTLRPGAPGVVGYNEYTYVANNPTTWIDPTGHITASTYARESAIGVGIVGGALYCAAAPA